jgi:hypothetical protein
MSGERRSRREQSARVRFDARARANVFAIAFAACAIAPSCAGFWRWPWGTTQRWPEPMETKVDPLPPGDSELYPPGPEDVLVVRHADPVQVRPAGLPSSFPLSFYNKSLRMSSGSAVYSAPGGRIEVIWPSATSVLLFGRGSGIVGSKSRGEPTFIFRQVERAEVMFKKEDQIELLGGAQLAAHSGPFVLDHTRDNILRVRNESKSAGQIAYRDANFVLDPGQVIDLPLLSAGSKPRRGETGLATVPGGGFGVEYSGHVEVLSKGADVTLRGLGEHEIQALGVRVKMERDEEVRFGGLTKEPVLAPTASTPRPPSPSASEEMKKSEPPPPPVEPKSEPKSEPKPEPPKPEPDKSGEPPKTSDVVKTSGAQHTHVSQNIGDEPEPERASFETARQPTS